MTTRTENLFARAQRVALLAAVVAAMAAVALAWHAPQALSLAWRFAVFGCFSPALGALIFTLIHRTTGGKWGDVLRPFLHAGVTLLPWIWLLALGTLLLPSSATQDAWPGYASRGMVALRGGTFAVLFFGLSVCAGRANGPWLGPVGLVVLLFTLHVVADDWIAALEPHWHSTGFGLVWMTSVAVAGFAIALVAALAAGHDPAINIGGGRSLGIDWGNLLLTAALLWCYVAFAQFLIIWSGNLPREIGWFQRRAHGGWLAVAVALAIFHFALPFVFLLSRRFKQFPAGLTGAALVLVAAQLTYTGWTILPASSPTTPASLGLALALLVAFGGSFASRYLVLIRRAEIRP